MIHSAVLTQYMRVTDGQTDRIGVAYTRYSIYAVARKNDHTKFCMSLMSFLDVKLYKMV